MSITAYKGRIATLGVHGVSARTPTEKLCGDLGVSMNDNGSADSEQHLRTLVADYEAKINEIADLVARVRHEINNPLTGVLGQAQLLLREDLNERARKRAQTIEQLAIRLRDIAAQLRQVQRPAAPNDKGKASAE